MKFKTKERLTRVAVWLSIAVGLFLIIFFPVIAALVAAVIYVLAAGYWVTAFYCFLRGRM